MYGAHNGTPAVLRACLADMSRDGKSYSSLSPASVK